MSDDLTTRGTFVIGWKTVSSGINECVLLVSSSSEQTTLVSTKIFRWNFVGKMTKNTPLPFCSITPKQNRGNSWWQKYLGTHTPEVCVAVVRSPSPNFTRIWDEVGYDRIPRPNMWVSLGTISALLLSFGYLEARFFQDTLA